MRENDDTEGGEQKTLREVNKKCTVRSPAAIVLEQLAMTNCFKVETACVNRPKQTMPAKSIVVIPSRMLLRDNGL